MAQWIFLEDFGISENIDQAINLDFVTNFAMRADEGQLVLFFGGARVDPHILAFDSPQKCQAAYDKLKTLLKIEKKKPMAA